MPHHLQGRACSVSFWYYIRLGAKSALFEQRTRRFGPGSGTSLLLTITSSVWRLGKLRIQPVTGEKFRVSDPSMFAYCKCAARNAHRPVIGFRVVYGASHWSPQSCTIHVAFND